MQKKFVLSILLIVLVCISFYIYETKFIPLTITIDQLKLVDAKIEERSFEILSERYDMSQNDVERLEKNSSRFKYVSIAYTCDNKSFFKNIEGAEFRFEDNQELPDIIIGSHPDIGLNEINILPNKANKHCITILIDPKEYSDDEIMQILQKVKITMVTKKNAKIIIESKPVALKTGARS